MGKDEATKAYENGGGPDSSGSGSGWRSRAVTIFGRRTRVVVVAAVVGGLVLAGLVVGAYAYDHAHKDQIADGVKVGDVDVGGLNPDQAAHRIQKRLVAPLHKPVVVKLGHQSYTLRASDLKVRADVNGMVDEAVNASQSWGMPGRIFRDITGGSVNTTVQPLVSYSRRAVNRFLVHVRSQIDRPPQDATVSPTGSSLNVVPAENGRTLKVAKLERRVNRVVNNGAKHKLVVAHVVITRPKVSTKEVASKYPVFLTLDRAAFTLRLWNDLKLTKSYSVAVGQQGLETPAGLYHIQDKQVDPSWHVPNSAWAGSLAGQVIPPGPSDPLKARWLGIFNGAGIHGTDETWSIGQAVSHGCVRMTIPDVIDLYPRVPVGTPIYIG
jgi:lipoprotein-anchoring transpeptidase ErfK/SrfK/outer membrane murein-binding lipoprotein Lpp